MRWFLLFLLVVPLRVDAKGIALIRDAEIEETLEMYAAPLLKAAGLSPRSVKIYLVHSKEINAFVAGGSNLFIHTGLIEKTQNVDQLLGVMAHEIGHIQAGHLIGLDEALKNARNTSLLGLALGALASLATGDASGVAAVGMGMSMSATRGFLAHTRTQEASADQAGLKFLKAIHVSPQGFYDFLKIIGEQTLVKRSDQDPYLQTHPLTEQRMNMMKNAVEASPYPKQYADIKWQNAHKRIVAKVRAFLESPMQTFKHYKSTDQSLEAHLARAIAFSVKVEVSKALAELDGLIAAHSGDAFFYELKGEILFKNRRTAEAVPLYLKAVSLHPQNALLKMNAAQVLLESKDASNFKKAQEFLLYAEQREGDNPFFWFLMSSAFAKLGDLPLASYALAERAMAEDNKRDAKFHLQRALKGVSKGSKYYTRLMDLQMQLDSDKKDKDK